MKKSYVFVSNGVSRAGGSEFDHFGQVGHFTEAYYQGVLARKGGAPFIPQEDFDRLGFTVPELLAVRGLSDLTDAVQDKRARAQQLYRDIVSQFASGGGGVNV